jgi:hypothetical protein
LRERHAQRKHGYLTQQRPARFFAVSQVDDTGDPFPLHRVDLIRDIVTLARSRGSKPASATTNHLFRCAKLHGGDGAGQQFGSKLRLINLLQAELK